MHSTRVLFLWQVWGLSFEPPSPPSWPFAVPVSPPGSILCSLPAGREFLRFHHSITLVPSFVGFCSTGTGAGVGAVTTTYQNDSGNMNRAEQILLPSSLSLLAHEPPSPPSWPFAVPASPPGSILCSLPAGREFLFFHHSITLVPSFVGFCSTGAGVATNQYHKDSQNQA